MIVATRDQSLVRPGRTVGQSIGPALRPVWPLVLGLPKLHAQQLGHGPQPSTHGVLVGIGKASPVVFTLAAAKLVAHINAATCFERRPQFGQHPRHVQKRYMQQAGAAPDRIVLGDLVHIFKAPNIHNKATVLTGPLGQLFRSIKSADAETPVSKCTRITPGASPLRKRS